ncbi:MAG: hypothetical protein WC342_04385 [Methanoregula sp.]|jgi:hypothetical protein
MDYNSFIAAIISSPYFSVLNLVIAIGGIILAIFFYLRSTKNREPVFAIRTYNILEDYSSKMTGLTINYKAETVKDLSVSKIAFWNRGRETIKKSDIPSGDQLRIVAKPGQKILNAEIITPTNSPNKFELSTIEDHGLVRIDFEYLDKNQGGVIQIIHTGTSSEDIAIEGTVMGFGKPVNSNIDARISKKLAFLKIEKPSRKIIRFIGLIVVLILALFSIVLIVSSLVVFSLSGLIVGLMYGSMTAWVYYSSVRSVVPKNLSIYEDNF